MRYIADLHIHSPYSRATSKSCDLAGLAGWAQIKGINVVATGDFTHPAWFSQLHEQLVPAEPGFFKLRQEHLPPALPDASPEEIPVRFLLSAEISSIYKRHGQVRKVHNILYVPDLAAAARINAKLAGIGNIESDGRPILGLDSRDLLEILLTEAPEGFLVPAHIWTPWFSLFGSKSGFDTIEECFGDLSHHIFALETGLSSDPEMNRRISALDRFTLISNSDCHSPGKLGREANLFATGFDYFALRDALRNGGSGDLAATIEFFPEEGKYHCDGHRKCQVCLNPQETRDLDSRCPVCGKPLTVGVLHRVMELADREHPVYAANAPAVHSIIPLPEILGEILDAGPATKGVTALYAKAISRCGSEFSLLLNAPFEEITTVSPLLAEAVARVRQGRVIRQPGYDGEFGTIRVFEKGERERLAGQASIFAEKRGRKKKAPERPAAGLFAQPRNTPAELPATAVAHNAEQEAVITATGRRILVAAGPGTGKTFTLVGRLKHLLRQREIPAAKLTAITFTNRAAAEIGERLEREVGPTAQAVFVGTFHRFCLDWLRRRQPGLVVIGDLERRRLLRRLFPKLGTGERDDLCRELTDYAERLASREDEVPCPESICRYLRELEKRQALDLDLVVPFFVERLRSDASFRKQVTAAVLVLLVDEFQDINASQYALVESLAEHAEVFAIGDPDQAIYGFRGSDLGFFFRFAEQPGCQSLTLSRNYRSAPEILAAAAAVISHNMHKSGVLLTPHLATPGRLEWYAAPSVAAEAEQTAQRIEQLVGGVSHYSLHTGHGNAEAAPCSFGDIAILCRLTQQIAPISEALAKHGIPCQVAGATPFYLKSPLRPVAALFTVAGGQATTAQHLELLGQWPGIGSATIDRLDQELPLSCPDFWQAASSLALPARVKTVLQEAGHQLARLRVLALEKGVAWAVDQAFTLFAIEPAESPAKRFRDFASLFAKDMQGFADHLLQNAQASVYDQRADAVALMTMHGAKGLEFRAVFLAGLEEGIIPCTFGRHASDLEEERRLFYVALTRARELVCLSMAAKRALHGRALTGQASRFVGELPARSLISSTPRWKAQQKPAATQMTLF